MCFLRWPFSHVALVGVRTNKSKGIACMSMKSIEIMLQINQLSHELLGI